MKFHARVHAVLARESDCAVVFRRGPSDKVAVLAWDLRGDTFTLGQWFRGRIYEYRCDLSPDGRHLLYFAAKYGRKNPMETAVERMVTERVGSFDLTHGSYSDYRKYMKKRETAEMDIFRSHAVEFDAMRRSPAYFDATWTAISRAPYLKALALWWNGTGWNGGGLFKNNRDFYLNRPPERIAATIPGVTDRHFRECVPDRILQEKFCWGQHAECPMVYCARLERDGWNFLKYEQGAWIYEKKLCCGFRLRKAFGSLHPDDTPGCGVYTEAHVLRNEKGKILCGGTEWSWADYDGKRDRIVFAREGAIYALDPLSPDAPVLLHDFNDMLYQRIAAPY